MSKIGSPDEKVAIIAVMTQSLTCGLAGGSRFERFVSLWFRRAMAGKCLYRA